MEEILIFLAIYNCHPTAQITVAPDDFTHYKDEVIYIAPKHKGKDHILVHELVHSCQYGWSGGSATTYREWSRREHQAIAIERDWIDR